MKIAVIKLGARITWETDAAVGPGEAISICKALEQGGAEVHVYTKILAKDTLHPSIQWHNILDEERNTTHMDALLVINGNVNFFGGAEDAAQIANYTLMNNFAGPVLYAMCDPELPLLQIWPSVSAKPWGTKYSEKDIKITRTDIVVLSQPSDLVKMSAKWSKKGVPVNKLVHFPFERFPLLHGVLPLNKTPSIDLLYGGTHRGGRRIPNLYKWYCGLPEDISVQIFGKIDQADFEKFMPKAPVKRYPEFAGMVKYNQMTEKMNSSVAHLVTGDPSYEELNIIPQRTYECMAAGNVVFIDAAMDTDRRIYPGGTYTERRTYPGGTSLAAYYLYVQDQEELIKKLRIIKYDLSFRLELIESQHKETAFDASEFCTSLVKTISQV
jgi:hypothetical protein